MGWKQKQKREKQKQKREKQEKKTLLNALSSRIEKPKKKKSPELATNALFQAISGIPRKKEDKQDDKKPEVAKLIPTAPKRMRQKEFKPRKDEDRKSRKDSDKKPRKDEDHKNSRRHESADESSGVGHSNAGVEKPPHAAQRQIKNTNRNAEPQRYDSYEPHNNQTNHNNYATSEEMRNQFSIKNAAMPPIVVIENLETGTSAEDVRIIMEEIGYVVDCRATEEMDRSVTAEVVFENSLHTHEAVKQFHGSYADGRLVRAYVSKVHRIQRSRADRVTQGPHYVQGWQGPPLYSDLVQRRTRPILRQ
ncbi:hypothetical protein TRVA0_008S02652 [Trichomonascus vanleenenianus]|uniref:uncharacterized protein n=1 Tax=Trichomonascus vanleenenianus TaxID=2268995 RepID=UPI003ECB45CA